MRRSVLSRAADLIWPPRSLLSDRLVDRPGVIEAEHWSRLVFLGRPWCACCGFPFETAEEAAALCGACLAEPPAYDTARAPIAYDDLSRRLVLDLKRAGRRDGLPLFSRWMAQAAGESLAEADVIIPAPLHWTRLLYRRFNQSAWLALSLGKLSGKPVLVDALQRVKRRRSQGDLTAAQRARNVAGAYRASSHALRDKVVLLVDDVLTTGATVSACARALRRAGVRKVHVVTLARVVRPTDVVI